MKRLLAVGAGVAGVLGVSRAILRNAGATCEERRAEMPGDDVVPGAKGRSTMAVTIAAPPKDVWPWLVQMGCTRAGWYSWDRLDNSGVPSADTIHPEWQSIEVGDRLPSTPDGRSWFTVAAVEPERALVLRATVDLRGRAYDPAGEPPRVSSDGSWSFLLEPHEEGTRLIVRGQGVTRPRLFGLLSDVLVWGPAHFVMQRRQFRNLKRRIESAPAPVEAPELVHSA